MFGRARVGDHPGADRVDGPQARRCAFPHAVDEGGIAGGGAAQFRGLDPGDGKERLRLVEEGLPQGLEAHEDENLVGCPERGGAPPGEIGDEVGVAQRPYSEVCRTHAVAPDVRGDSPVEGIIEFDHGGTYEEQSAT